MRRLSLYMTTEKLVPQFQVTCANWRAILYALTMVAVKFCDDEGDFDNIDWVDQMKVFDLQTTNKFENLILNLIQFNLTVDQETFETYFY